ncbi:MAG: AAA family ATPase, partial [Bacteroidota bacterium]
QIYDLISKGDLYFLSRPRRFGKSLLLSKLHHIFSGNKELFKGLFIHDKTNYDFSTHPVLHFNFADYGHQVKNLEEALHVQLEQYGEKYNIKFSNEDLSYKFTTLVQQIALKGKRVVILIDEYDKPIVDFLTDVEQAVKNQLTLRNLFSPLKGLEAKGYLRFLFITGVSKFSHVSLFSDLNNLKDLTISNMAHDLVGITPTELLDYFDDYIQRAADSFKMSREKLLTGVQLWYNGCSFEGHTRLYNPFSLLNFFSENRFRNFWFATGTPTFLVKAIQDQYVNPIDLEHTEVTDAFFNKFSIEKLEIIGLLFQTGYLTIKEAILEGYETTYVLGYPNVEVRKSFIYNLLEAFTFQSHTIVGAALIKMEKGLQKGNVQTFIDQLKVLFSDMAYQLLPKSKKHLSQEDDQQNFKAWEGYFHSVIYLITAFMGLQVQSEIAKHKGRLDLVAQTENFIYLMEFKLDEPATDAIAQIKNREYAAAYEQSDKTVILVGINFSKENRNVDDWESEIWKR